jgi:hypothetical protein
MEKLMLPGIFGTKVSIVAGAMVWAAINQQGAFTGYSTKEIRENAKKLGA